MSKQKKPINTQCQAKLGRGESGRCLNPATWGIYRWNHGETDVNLDKPVACVCGQHKPQWTSPNQMHRNVRLLT